MTYYAVLDLNPATGPAAHGVKVAAPIYTKDDAIAYAAALNAQEGTCRYIAISSNRP